jgi:hypothetical protein
MELLEIYFQNLCDTKNEQMIIQVETIIERLIEFSKNTQSD